MALTLKQDFTKSQANHTDFTSGLAQAARIGPTLTYSIGSAAMYFNSDGDLRFAPHNLYVRSEEFDNASWTKNRIDTVTANDATAPDGTATAEHVLVDTAFGFHDIDQTETIGNVDMTASCYFKADGTDKVHIRSTDLTTGGYVGKYDLGAGTASLDSSSIGSWTNGAVDIQDVGNGWYRCSLSATKGAGASAVFAFGPSKDDETYSYTGVAEDCWQWGAQLNKGLTPLAYTPTTTADVYQPRLASHTYNGTSWVNRGVLIEEARTNELLGSDGLYFSPGGWLLVGTMSRNEDTGDTTAPDGNNTATELIGANGAQSNDSIYLDTTGLTTNTNYTFSVFCKPGIGAESSDWVRLSLNNSQVSFETRYFDVGSTPALGTVTGTLVDSGYEEVGNGWIRCWICAYIGSTATNFTARVYITDGDNTTNYTGDGTNPLTYVWGAQLEQGNFPTSYIPTTTASVTRNRDEMHTTTMDWLDAAASNVGTYVVDFTTTEAITAHYLLDCNDGNTSDRQFIHIVSTEAARLQSASTGAGTDINCTTTNNSITANTAHEVAAAYNTDDAACSLDGATAITDTDCTEIPAQNSLIRFDVGMNANSQQQLNGFIKHLRYYDERLANAILENPPPFDARPMLMLMGVGR